MISQRQIPAEFLCPITAELMEDPVILADGRSYERAAIMKWLEGSKRSPMTGETLDHCSVVANVNLRNVIVDWRDTQAVAAAVNEEETALRELPRQDLEALRSQLQKAFKCDEGITLVIEGVKQIYNDDLLHRFGRKRAELEALHGACPVLLKYHGTTPEAAAAIARQGFRLPQADGDGDFVGQGLRVFYTESQQQATNEHLGAPLMFGQAVYVSTDLEKATRFAEGAVVLCQCAVGRVMDARTASYKLTRTKVNQLGFDSVRAVPGCQEEGGCASEELALYASEQALPTHIVYFKLSKSGLGNLVAQHGSRKNLAKAKNCSLEGVVNALTSMESDSSRIACCKELGDVARDDQSKASLKFFTNPMIIKQVGICARSQNEALQFEALRAWFNFSFNNPANQNLAMQNLGANFLTSLLDAANPSLQLRAIGLIWNLTQHDAASRHIFTDAGATHKLERILSRTMQEVLTSMSPPWGLVQLTLGALANLAMTCAASLKVEGSLSEVGEDILAMQLVAPHAVQQQAMRLLCNIISEGNVDPEWQANSYSYRTSAPREHLEVACLD